MTFLLNHKSFFYTIAVAFLWAYTIGEMRADHFWGADNLFLCEDNPGSNSYDISFTALEEAGVTTDDFYYELYVVEGDCPADDSFAVSAGTGCSLLSGAGTLNPATGYIEYDIIVDSNIPLCPGKTYTVLLVTRRMQGGSNCTDPEDRDDGATVLGALTQYIPGQFGNTFPWLSPPQNWDDRVVTSCNADGCTQEGEAYDANWAFVQLQITTPGDPLWDFQVDISVNDACNGQFNQTFAEDQTTISPATSYMAGTPGACPDDGTPASSTNLIEDFGGQAATVICGAIVTATYTSNNSCGPNFGSNTFIVSDNSNILSTPLGTSAAIDGVTVVDDNGDGRFETINGLAVSGTACQDGLIDLTFENSNCATEDGFIDINVTYQVDVLYPTSEFADPERVNCSDMCAMQNLANTGTQWVPTGLNTGGATTIESPLAVSQGFAFAWSGQICPPTITGTNCDDSSAIVEVDACAACGIYDITYEITNTNCPNCSTTTTKQVEVVTPLIVNECADLALACGDYTFTLSADVVECNPADGAPTATPYTGSGALVWSRDDGGADNDFLVTAPASGTCTTVTFTPAWVSGGTCAACDAAGLPVTVAVCTPEDLELCTTDYAATITNWVADQEALLNGAVAGLTDCNTPLITNDYKGAAPPPCGEVVVNFTVSSGAMTSTCAATATVNDTEMPTISCPPNVAGLICGDVLPIGATDINAFVALGGTASDNCVPPLSISYVDDVDPTTFTFCPADAPFVVTRTYTAMDDCMNINTCNQTFTFNSAVSPTIVCPENETVACVADIVVGSPEVTADCMFGSTITTVGPTLATGAADCPNATYELIYTITDDCGQTADCTQTFTIANDAPTITCPADCPVVCASDIIPANPEFTASCGQGELIVSEAVINGDPGCDGTTYTYTYTVTDDCGRSAICEQVFTIVNDCFFIDFDYDDNGHKLKAGTIIKNQYNDFSVHTENHYRYPMIFDTGHPTNGDFDLGTPNENYGGPGIGNGGFNNNTFQGNALIVSKNSHVPNETEGKLIFKFYCSVTIQTVDLLDMKCQHSEIELYDERGHLIDYLDIPAYGVNSFNTFDVFTSGVHTMIIDLDCGGGVTGFKYCKDNTPGAMCDNMPNPDLCYDYHIDHGECGIGWNYRATYGTTNFGLETVTIRINDDEDHILKDTKANGLGLQIGIDPHDVNDQLTVCYNLSQSSNHIIFDIVDLDRKHSSSKQQEEVCVYGLLGDSPTEIYPEITSLDGSVHINGNCAEATTNSAYGHDESVLVEFTNCIDKVVIEYGTGSNSPTHNPTYSKIIIGESIFSVSQCKEDCDCLDDDQDGVCNELDICEGSDDNIDTDNDGVPDDCDSNIRISLADNISIYPNPMHSGSSISITTEQLYENAALLMYDDLGRLAAQKRMSLSKGINKINLPAANFATGVYFVQLKAKGFTSKVHKLMIVE